MKCPTCQKEGLVSCVYEGISTSTCIAWNGYYNEKGTYMRTPDPNIYTTEFRCSEGHSFSISSREGEEDKTIIHEKL